MVAQETKSRMAHSCAGNCEGGRLAGTDAGGGEDPTWFTGVRIRGVLRDPVGETSGSSRGSAPFRRPRAESRTVALIAELDSCRTLRSGARLERVPAILAQAPGTERCRVRRQRGGRGDSRARQGRACVRLGRAPPVLRSPAPHARGGCQPQQGPPATHAGENRSVGLDESGFARAERGSALSDATSGGTSTWCGGGGQRFPGCTRTRRGEVRIRLCEPMGSNCMPVPPRRLGSTGESGVAAREIWGPRRTTAIVLVSAPQRFQSSTDRKSTR